MKSPNTRTDTGLESGEMGLGCSFWVAATLPCHSTWEPRAYGPTSVVRGFLCVESLTNMR